MKKLAEILAGFNQLIPENFISKKPVFSKGRKTGEVDYIAWIHCCELLDTYTQGYWNWEIRTQFLGDRVVVEGKLTIITDDGTFTREATGWESLEVEGYGDATSNAEAMAMRRCCAKFGLGRYLWEKDKPIAKPIESLPAIEKPKAKGEISREEWLRKKAESNYTF